MKKQRHYLVIEAIPNGFRAYALARSTDGKPRHFEGEMALEALKRLGIAIDRGESLYEASGNQE